LRQTQFEASGPRKCFPARRLSVNATPYRLARGLVELTPGMTRLFLNTQAGVSSEVDAQSLQSGDLTPRAPPRFVSFLYYLLNLSQWETSDLILSCPPPPRFSRLLRENFVALLHGQPGPIFFWNRSSRQIGIPSFCHSPLSASDEVHFFKGDASLKNFPP